MDKTIYSKKIAESLSSGNHPKEFATLFVALLRQLAMGGPVSREKLAAALGWSGARVATVLEQAPGTEYDDEATIIGLGLTLRETDLKSTTSDLHSLMRISYAVLCSTKKN